MLGVAGCALFGRIAGRKVRFRRRVFLITEQVEDAGHGGAGEEGRGLGRGAEVDQPAAGQDGHLVEQVQAGEQVGGEHHGGAVVGHGTEMAHEPLLHPRVEPGGGLVEEEHSRPDEQFGTDGHPLALAAAQLVDGPVAHTLQAQGCDGGVHQGGPPFVAQVTGQAEQGGAGQAAGHGQLRVEDVVLGHVADIVAQHGAGRGQRRAVDQHRAPVRPGDADERLQQGGLAGAARAEDTDKLAGLDGQGDVGAKRLTVCAVPAQAHAFQAHALAVAGPEDPQGAVLVQGEAEAAGAHGHGVRRGERARADGPAVDPGAVQAGVVGEAEHTPLHLQDCVPAAHGRLERQGDVAVAGPPDHPLRLRRQQDDAGRPAVFLEAQVAGVNAQTDEVAVLQGVGAVDPPAVDEHAVGGAQILYAPAVGAVGPDPGMAAGNGRARGDHIARAAVPADGETGRLKPVGPVGEAGGERDQPGGGSVCGGGRGVHNRGGWSGKNIQPRTGRGPVARLDRCGRAGRAAGGPLPHYLPTGGAAAPGAYGFFRWSSSSRMAGIALSIFCWASSTRGKVGGSSASKVELS